MGFLDRFRRPPTEDKFARLVIEMLSAVGDQRRANYDKANGRLLLTLDGKDAGMLNLRNLFKEYCHAPHGDRATLLRRTCIGLAKQVDLPDDFEDAKPDLLPTIRTRSMIDVMRLDVEIKGSTWTELATVPVSDHLLACLVYDLPTTMRFVNLEDVQRWDVTIYQAMEAARQNLEEREFSLASLGKVFIFLTGDAFDATRLLLVDRILSLDLAGEPVALPLNRDSLLVTGTAEAEGLGIMADLAEKKQDEPRPVCPIPHKLSGNTWEPWLPPADHPHHAKFRTLELRYLYGEYAEQKSLLEKRHEQTGQDIFVATYSVMEREGTMRSWSTWSKGITTWLPKTDYVGLYSPDPQRMAFAPWDRLQTTAGHLMESLDCYPPRWSVSDFPTPDQIERCGAEDWTKAKAT